MSLHNDKTTAINGALTSEQAANVEKIWDIEEKEVTQISEGIYRISGWGIGNIIAVEGKTGWIIVDTGDSLEMALEQRAALEEKVGKINVEAVLYTHSHYVWGAKAWQDEETTFYAHEDMMDNLSADVGVNVISGNFGTRAMVQFGMLHPEKGEDAFPNKLGFGTDKLEGTKALVPPSVTFEDNIVETHTIAGIEVEVLPSKTDVTDSVAYHFVDKKLLVSNALNSGSMFNLYTLRGDWYRDPMVLVEAADLALSRDIDIQVDIHGVAHTTSEAVTESLQEFRDQMQVIHDQTYRAIALGMDAQGAAEFVYMPMDLRKDKETYGQVESHVKRVYNARIGWMGWDVYDINPMAKNDFSEQLIKSLGGMEKVLSDAQESVDKNTIEGSQWALYLTSQALQKDPTQQDAKMIRAQASRELGQRTSSANARGFYISEALLHEGKLNLGGHTITDFQQVSQALGAVTEAKLAASPLADNVQYLRYLVDSRLAEGKTAEFNVNFTEEAQTYGIALRNGVIAITPMLNAGVTVELTKSDWSQLILGEKTFESLNKSLSVIDQSLVR
jgi:alkyl sulfatase BDS1-like metallo-beta-lactamase superfamily hydrolase